MMKFSLFLVCFLITTVASASSLNEFFHKLEGSWALTSGSMILYSPEREQTDIKLTKLSTKVTKADHNEWRFEETYCTLLNGSEDCLSTTYFYRLTSDKLFLVTQEGTTELKVVEGSADVLGFMILSEASHSLTLCSFIGEKEMFQEGVAYNADGSSSAQTILIHKIQD